MADAATRSTAIRPLIPRPFGHPWAGGDAGPRSTRIDPFFEARGRDGSFVQESRFASICAAIRGLFVAPADRGEPAGVAQQRRGVRAALCHLGAEWALARHRAGEKLFVDYAGHTVEVVDPASGEIRTASLGAACAALPTLLK